MSVFILSNDDEERIREAARVARASPMSFEAVRQAAEFARIQDGVVSGKRPEGAPTPQEVLLTFGWRVSISCEEQPPGLCFHISMSSPTPAKTLPRPEAIKMILDALACDRAPLFSWIEDYQEAGVYAGRAVNLLVAVPKGALHA